MGIGFGWEAGGGWLDFLVEPCFTSKYNIRVDVVYCELKIRVFIF